MPRQSMHGRGWTCNTLQWSSVETSQSFFGFFFRVLANPGCFLLSLFLLYLPNINPSVSSLDGQLPSLLFYIPEGIYKYVVHSCNKPWGTWLTPNTLTPPPASWTSRIFRGVFQPSFLVIAANHNTVLFWQLSSFPKIKWDENPVLWCKGKNTNMLTKFQSLTAAYNQWCFNYIFTAK